MTIIFGIICASVCAPIVVLMVGVIWLFAAGCRGGGFILSLLMQQTIARWMCSCFLFVVSYFLRFVLVFCSRLAGFSGCNDN